MIRLPGAAVWTSAIVLAAVFVFAGFLKLDDPSAIRWSERFLSWGYPANTHYVVGVLEILSGLGVLIRKCRRLAAATLVALMTGALFTHAVNGEFPRLIPPLVLGGLAWLTYAASPRQSSDHTSGHALC
jgi:uncharacterized membrane protein YphA (DoxX/SURF4 family)